MDKMQCSTCDKEVIPIEGVTAIEDRGYWWCAHCVNTLMLDGKSVVNFPSKGKLIPISILTPNVSS